MYPKGQKLRVLTGRQKKRRSALPNYEAIKHRVNGPDSPSQLREGRTKSHRNAMGNAFVVTDNRSNAMNRFAAGEPCIRTAV